MGRGRLNNNNILGAARFRELFLDLVSVFEYLVMSLISNEIKGLYFKELRTCSKLDILSLGLHGTHYETQVF